MTGTIRHFTRAANGDLGALVATPAMDLLDAAYHTAHAYEGGIPALALRMPKSTNASGAMTPMSANTLQHKVNPHCHTHHVFLREARDMMVLTGNFSILHALNADTGHVSIQLTGSQRGVTMSMVAKMAEEFSDVVNAVTKATSRKSQAGAKVSPNERSMIRREAAELIAALNSLVASACSDDEEGA